MQEWRKTQIKEGKNPKQIQKQKKKKKRTEKRASKQKRKEEDQDILIKDGGSKERLGNTTSLGTTWTCFNMTGESEMTAAFCKALETIDQLSVLGRIQIFLDFFVFTSFVRRFSPFIFLWP